MLGANTFTLRRFPWFGNNTTEEEWREWQRRPRIYFEDAQFVRGLLPGVATAWGIKNGLCRDSGQHARRGHRRRTRRERLHGRAVRLAAGNACVET